MHFKPKHLDFIHIKFGGHHASNFVIIYSDGGHIGFNYTHTSTREHIVYTLYNTKKKHRRTIWYQATMLDENLLKGYINFLIHTTIASNIFTMVAIVNSPSIMVTFMDGIFTATTDHIVHPYSVVIITMSIILKITTAGGN